MAIMAKPKTLALPPARGLSTHEGPMLTRSGWGRDVVAVLFSWQWTQFMSTPLRQTLITHGGLDITQSIREKEGLRGGCHRHRAYIGPKEVTLTDDRLGLTWRCTEAWIWLQGWKGVTLTQKGLKNLKALRYIMSLVIKIPDIEPTIAFKPLTDALRRLELHERNKQNRKQHRSRKRRM